MVVGKRVSAVLCGLVAVGMLGGCAALLAPRGDALLNNLTVYSPPLKRNLVLRDGHFRDAGAGVHARLLHVREGELGGSRGRDAAAVLEVTSPTAGTYYQLVAAVTVEGGRRASAIYLGNRLALEEVAIEKGEVRLRLKRARAGDATCCPSLALTERYRWHGDRLQEVAASLTATRWELVELWGRPLKGGEPPHLTFGPDQRARGFGGCNPLKVGYRVEGRTLRLDGVGGGQKYCADTPEEDFIGALILVDRFTLQGGVLALFSGDEVLARLRAAP